MVTHIQWLRGYAMPSYSPDPRCKSSDSWSIFCPYFAYTPWSSVECGMLCTPYGVVLALGPAIRSWALFMANKKVVVYCDNQAAESIINRGSCHRPSVMASLHSIFWRSAKSNFRIHAVYHKGIDIAYADAASYLHEPGQLKFTPVFCPPPPQIALEFPKRENLGFILSLQHIMGHIVVISRWVKPAG